LHVVELWNKVRKSSQGQCPKKLKDHVAWIHQKVVVRKESGGSVFEKEYHYRYYINITIDMLDMLDQKENQGYDLVVSISFDPVADMGNGRGNNNGKGNNCNNNIVSKDSSNKGSIEAMQGDQLLLIFFFEKVGIYGLFQS
jgi:hypothetical protein